MACQPEQSATKVSRRSVLLQGAACAAGAATILAASAYSAKAANPLPQASVRYQNTPKDDRQCSNCSLFAPPNACKNVVGEISPNGWCIIWRKV